MELSGVVIRNDNHGRFVPDENPNERLRLTTAPESRKDYPDAEHEVNLYDLIGQRISFECQGGDDHWIWGVKRESLKINYIDQSKPGTDALGQSLRF